MRMSGIALRPILVLLQFLLLRHLHQATVLSSSNVIIVSSLKYPKSQVPAFGLRYIRVDLPTSFSSVSIAVLSDVDANLKGLKFESSSMEREFGMKVELSKGWVDKMSPLSYHHFLRKNSKGISDSKSMLPLICFRDGSPPIPDILNTSMIESGPLSNESFIQIRDFQNVLCYPLQKVLLLKLSNEQISPGVWYVGIFNGIGASRTQSKMINRSPAYSFSANITVEGCTTSGMWGPYCNWTIEQLSCYDSASAFSRRADNFSDKSIRSTESKLLSCGSSPTCKREIGLKIYSLDIFGIVENLTIMAINISFNVVNAGKVDLVCFARHGGMPSASLHDYAGSIIEAPLVVHSPKIGRWFFAILSTDSREQVGRSMHSGDMQDCYSLQLQVFECPVGKAGINCSSDRYTLQG